MMDWVASVSCVAVSARTHKINLKNTRQKTHNHTGQMTVQLPLGVHIVSLKHLRKVRTKVVRHGPVLIYAVAIGRDAACMQSASIDSHDYATHYFFTLIPAASLALRTSH
jgi:3-polyprenyl-4-hydroxybenzoate decarboxylase